MKWYVNYNAPNDLLHYGVKNQKWGVRKYQNEDGSLTSAGRIRYNNGVSSTLRNRVDGEYYKKDTSKTTETKTKKSSTSSSSSSNSSTGTKSTGKKKSSKKKTTKKKVDKKLLIQRSNKYMAQLTGYNPDDPKPKKAKEEPLDDQVKKMMLGKQTFDARKMIKHLSTMSPEMRKKTLLSIKRTRPAMYQAIIRAGSPYRISSSTHNIADQAKKKVSFIQHDEAPSEDEDILHAGKKGMHWGVRNKKAKTGKKKGISDKADKMLGDAHKNLGKASYKDALKHYKTIMTAKKSTLKAFIKKHNLVDSKGNTMNTKQYKKYCLNAVKKAQSGQKDINKAKADNNVAKNITNRALGNAKRYDTTPEKVKAIPKYRARAETPTSKAVTKKKVTAVKKTTPKKASKPEVKPAVPNTLRNRINRSYYNNR